MPENEIPPVSRGDIYYIIKFCTVKKKYPEKIKHATLIFLGYRLHLKYNLLKHYEKKKDLSEDLWECRAARARNCCKPVVSSSEFLPFEFVSDLYPREAPVSFCK